MAMKEIRMERKAQARKYTLAEIGALLGVNTSTALRYEQGQCSMTDEQRRKVAEYLGCKVSEL